MKNVKKKRKEKGGSGERKMEQGQVAKELLDRMKIQDNEAFAYRAVFSVLCVPSNLHGKWRMGHTSRQEWAF